MSYFVYVLRSKVDGKLYIGSSGDIEKRLSDHTCGRVDATKKRRPLELVYKEIFENKELARKRELFFKTGKGRLVLRNLM
ncbi:MAG: GIY-YIG nuclease family protein, partial [Deltaproteobacteria bacterium]|nr:GIY-YIG nuclease family protein [Deltaproteobacteria bacterium]